VHVVRVVLVDDSALLRDRLTELLDAVPGVEVIGEAGTAHEAVTLILRLRPDLVVLDIRLPDGDGLAVLEAVRHLQSAPAVVMLTNYPNEYYRQRSYAAGAVYFLDKSMEFDRLPEVAAELLAATGGGQPA